MPSSASLPQRNGIFGDATLLEVGVRVVLILSIITCSVRYVSRHPLDENALLVIGGALGLAGWYLLRSVLCVNYARVWVGILVVLWALVTIIAPSFAWTAVPIAFAVLQLTVFPVAAALATAMTLIAALSSLRIASDFDLTLVVGPLGIALVTLLGYRYLQVESVARQRLVDELVAAQADLVLAQRKSGAITERNRLSRELHDSIGQSLSSITLFLNAATQQWDTNPQLVREYLEQAGKASHDGLNELRIVVRDLAETELESATDGEGLAASLEHVLSMVAPGIKTQLLVHGTPYRLDTNIATAIIRSVQGALTNCNEHSKASEITISVTYEPREIHVDIGDNGQGFTPSRLSKSRLRGRGLAGITKRITDLGGQCNIESTPGEGATVSLTLPRNI